MMKRITAILLFFCFNVSFASVYSYDRSELDLEFKKLEQIEEQFVKEGRVDPLWLNSIQSAEPIDTQKSNEFYFDAQSFFWGFCCCPVGVFIVPFSANKDSDQKGSFWIGVGAFVVLTIASTASIYASVSCTY